MGVTEAVACLAIAGLVGGFIGSLPVLHLPQKPKDGNWDWGFVANILFGAVTGVGSQMEALKNLIKDCQNINCADLAVACITALIAGLGGANWVKARIDGSGMKAAAVAAAAKQPDSNKAAEIAAAKSGREALRIAQSMK